MCQGVCGEDFASPFKAAGNKCRTDFLTVNAEANFRTREQQSAMLTIVSQP